MRSHATACPPNLINQGTFIPIAAGTGYVGCVAIGCIATDNDDFPFTALRPVVWGWCCRWYATHGVKWMLFFQDTNALIFKTALSAVGVSVTEGFVCNSIAGPRQAKRTAQSCLVCDTVHEIDSWVTDSWVTDFQDLPLHCQHFRFLQCFHNETFNGSKFERQDLECRV